MQVSVEQTSQLGRKLTVTLPMQQVDDALAKRLQQFAKTAKIDGFRPGKVPLRLIKSRYGDALRGEIIEDLVKSSYHNALTEQALEPAGMPKLALTQQEEGQDVQYTAEIEVYPEVTLANLSAITLEKEVSTLTDAQVDARIDVFRKQLATWEPVARASQLGDKLTLDFVGTIDNVAFEGGTAQGIEIELGAGRMIPGFEEGLLNRVVDTQFDFSVRFPDDYGAADLAGKDAVFAISLHKVSAAVLPALDDALATTLGINEGGFAQLRTQVREVMQKELDNILQNRLKRQVMNKLLELNPLELPNALVEQEVQELRKQALQDIKQRLQSAADVADIAELAGKLDKDRFVQQAKDRVALGLLVMAAVKQFAVVLDDARMRDKIEDFANLYQEPEAARNMIFRDEARLQELQTIVLEEQVVNVLLQQMQVVDKHVTYEELLQQ